MLLILVQLQVEVTTQGVVCERPSQHCSLRMCFGLLKFLIANRLIYCVP